jgi:hypothetical protein
MRQEVARSREAVRAPKRGARTQLGHSKVTEIGIEIRQTIETGVRPTGAKSGTRVGEAARGWHSGAYLKKRPFGAPGAVVPGARIVSPGVSARIFGVREVVWAHAWSLRKI